MNEVNGGVDGEPRVDQSDRSTAVSIFEQDASGNDFPVLKAFQQYLEAEQAKSRKRMLNLAVFFVILLVIVVIAFSLIMGVVINRNQSLSDRLLDIALRGQTQQPPQSVVTVQQPPAQVQMPAQPQQDLALKLLIEQLQKQQSAQATVPQQNPPTAVPSQAQAPVTTLATSSDPTAESLEIQRQRIELQRQQEALRREQEKLKADKEKVRLEQVEQHRRRLYPEYYAREDAKRATQEAAKKVTPPPKETRPVVAPAPKPKPVAPAAAQKTQPVPVASRPKETPSAVPSQSVPTPKAENPKEPSSPSRGTSASQANQDTKVDTITIGSEGKGAIPWLIELPENDSKTQK